jgi:TPP-dependent pyruvate/acetoin dehydrogenase alpha subunit
MLGNKIVYKEAFEQARSGKPRSLLQRLMFRFQDHYTQSSREQGEHDGAAARDHAASRAGSAPTGTAEV